MVSKKTFGVTLTVAALLASNLAVLTAPAPCRACFSIVVGKDASADGYVVMAHNEDDSPPQIVNHHKVPRKRYSPGEKVTLRNGGQLDQVQQTWAYIWSEMPGMLFSDSYINEWGVSVTSDNCPSREDKPEITDGGIGYMLRRLVAQRARTAREGVLLAGKLVERFGYIDSGRTYIVCDPDEGWLFCVVNGKHWLAQRVADDEVAMVANTYTVRRVDLSDTDNFLGSSDIIDYAMARGWYDPARDGELDFAAVYANPEAASNPSNSGRQWNGLRYVASKPIPLGSDLPFSVVPRSKVGVAEAMQILRHDKDQPELQLACPTESPSTVGCAICRGMTQTSFAVQLRRSTPLDIGIVYWVCLAPPGTSFYIPFHFGIPDFPAGFELKSQRPSQTLFDRKVTSPFRADALQAFWTFSNFRDKVLGTSADAIARARAQAEDVERNALALQKPLEEVARQRYVADRTTAMQLLANYSYGIYMSAFDAMDRVLSER
ncbi:MAG: C69 family dipeptidase [Phycisphaerales bacterium]|nr:MAG: C69 family dipeptidase [Phycisphaerales bacterium]